MATNGSPVRLSAIMGQIAESTTATIFGKVSDMKSRGEVVNGALCVGQPDFPPPPEAIQATADAAAKGQTNYTAVPGTLELRKAIGEYLQEHKKVAYAPEEVVVTNGGKQAIYQVMLALCQSGDEVIVPAPYWTSYPDIVKLSGATPVIFETTGDEGYSINAEKLAKAITPQTRMIVVCNPSNPTGCAMTAAQLEAIAAVLRKPENQHVYVLADEIYERITFEGLQHVSFAALDGMRDRTLIINGFAKAFSMTGYRLGYLAAAKPIAQAVAKLQSQITSCASSISQYAGIAALKSDRAYVDGKVAELEQKRDLTLKLIAELPDVKCPKPSGAFYLFPDISAYYGSTTETGAEINNSTQLCMHLLDKYRVALVPGDAFGGPNCLRLSYAATEENIADAISKLGQCLQGLNRKRRRTE